MTAAAVAFADRSQIVLQRFAHPRIRADRYLGAKSGRRDRYCVGRIRKQIIGDELVVPLDAVLNQVEIDNSALARAGFPNHIDVMQMNLMQTVVLG